MAGKTLGTVQEAREGAMFPVGLYRVEFMGFGEDVPDNFNPGRYQWHWRFKVAGVEYSEDDEAEDMVGQELYGYSSQGLTENHKAYKWVSALLGQPPGVGTDLDEEDLIGRQAIASVVSHTRQDGTESTKIAQEDGLRPIKKKGKKKAKPEPEPEEEEDDDEDSPF